MIYIFVKNLELTITKKTVLVFITFYILFCSLPLCLSSQNSIIEYPEELNRKRYTGVIITGSVLYTGTMIGLYSLWYADYPKSSFHFFNDNSEWLQVDKVGHITTSYYVGRIGYTALKWAGIKEKKAIWLGGSTGFIFLTTVEIFDGFSAEWGASWGDVVANGLGTALFIGQQLAWNEQRISLKFSFHKTEYAQYGPDLLGENTIQQVLKDYNGQTYWLSANIYSFLRKESKFPKWLNIAVGYGAKGMLGPNNNPSKYEGEPLPDFNRMRQYYLSLDIDLTRIRTKSKALNILLNLIGFIKVPLPTIEYNKDDKFRFYFFYL